MRTRFAPSPTGLLHVGGLRTALFSWLVARQSKGTFYMRIEDTDQARYVPGAVENIIRTLAWAGLTPDEGVMLRGSDVMEDGPYGPYFQSKRLPIYQEHADRLLQSGHAYRCFCSPNRLWQMRQEQQTNKLPPMYDRHCVHMAKGDIEQQLQEGQPCVIRMNIPRERTIAFDDDIRGTVTFRGDTIDDQVLLKSDGFPTYHLAHVVDDHMMDTTVVIRGEEWLSSLPKHLLLFDFLGWTPPRYAHVPLLLNPDKSKLSKRQGDVAAEDYREKGYLPEALLNFLVLLGWNPGTTQEIFSLEELIDQFSLERVQKSGAIFDLEKLNWLQGQWMRKLPLSDLTERLRPFVPAAAKDTEFEKKVALIQERITLLNEAPDLLGFFYENPIPTKELLANPKQKVTQDLLPVILDALIMALWNIADHAWNEESIQTSAEKIMSDQTLTRGQILWPLRASLTGTAYSPGAYEVAAALGKEETIKRLDRAKSVT